MAAMDLRPQPRTRWSSKPHSAARWLLADAPSTLQLAGRRDPVHLRNVLLYLYNSLLAPAPIARTSLLVHGPPAKARSPNPLAPDVDFVVRHAAVLWCETDIERLRAETFLANRRA